MAGQRHGVFVFPNQGMGPLPGPGMLRFRVQLRHCQFGTVLDSRYGIPLRVQLRHCQFGTVLDSRYGIPLPDAVDVEWASEGEVAAGVTGMLRLRAAIGASSTDTEAAAAAWPEAVAQVERILQPANLQVVVEQVVRLPEPTTGELSYEPGQSGNLDRLFARASAMLSPADERRFVPVLLTPCLRYHDPASGEDSAPAGQTLRIPDYVGAADVAAASFVAIAGCTRDSDEVEPAAWRDGRQLGTLVAHELGHFLGLYHSDTQAGAGMSGVADGNLMVSKGLVLDRADLGFSAAQLDVIRRHPAVTFAAP